MDGMASAAFPILVDSLMIFVDLFSTTLLTLGALWRALMPCREFRLKRLSAADLKFAFQESEPSRDGRHPRCAA